jgi:hypothetical protein
MAVPGFYRCGGLHALHQLVPPLDPWIVVQVFPVQPVHSAQAAPHVVASLNPWPLAKRARRHCSRLVACFCPDLLPSLGCHRLHSFLLGTATSTGDTSPDSPHGEPRACLRCWSGNLDSGRSSTDLPSIRSGPKRSIPATLGFPPRPPLRVPSLIGFFNRRQERHVNRIEGI